MDQPLNCYVLERLKLEIGKCVCIFEVYLILEYPSPYLDFRYCGGSGGDGDGGAMRTEGQSVGTRTAAAGNLSSYREYDRSVCLQASIALLKLPLP